MPYTSGIPFAPNSPTSYEAALRAAPFVAEQGVKVYRWLSTRGDSGGTQKEAAVALGMERPSLCARFNALEERLAIEKTDERRGGCAVYRVRRAEGRLF